MKNLYIGIMSGTSLDGIDVTLCRIAKSSCKLLFSKEYQFPKELKESILKIISGDTTIKEIGELDHKLGVLFSDVVSKFLTSFKIDSKEINAIGLHGQTLWHQPKGEFPFSMQLGNPNVVVSKTGIKTVTDFRRADIANGGEGAPFAPVFHKFLFSSLNKNIAVLNIGGMANLTILDMELKGWDVGCGNVLLDMWINKTKGEAYDKDGEFAKSGNIDKKLLNAMLNDKYFKQAPPKSTGREYFNETWLANFLPVFHTTKDEDIQRTLLELSAQSIANDLKKTKSDTLIVCGGGAKNNFLMKRISELCSCKVKHSEEFGIDGNFIESMAFAWFAYKRVHNEVVDLKSVTGTSKNSLLGGVYG